jgi:Abortive infection alpha
VLPLIEHATMENEDDLHELWENLLVSALDSSEEELKRTYVSVLGELTAKDAHALRRLYAEWLHWTKRGTTPEIRGEGEHRYSSGLVPENAESAVLFFRLGLVRPVRVEVEEYRRKRAVHEIRDPIAIGVVEEGDKTLVLSDLDVVALTEFGEKFCKAVIDDVSGLYEPPVHGRS